MAAAGNAAAIRFSNLQRRKNSDLVHGTGRAKRPVPTTLSGDAMDKGLGARICVLLIAAVASGCAATGWDGIYYGGSLPVTHFINGQLVAEMARDEP
jgi:hypothetical protein